MASGFFVPEDGLALVLANQAIYQNLLRSFIDHHQNLADRIDHLIEHNDRPELIRFCHTTKSTTGHMGSSVVQQQAMACELQLKSTPGPLTAAEKADLASLVQNMLHLMDLAEAYLASQSLTSGPSPATPVQTASSAGQTGADPAAAGQTDAASIWQLLRNSLDGHDPKNSRKYLSQLQEQTEQESDQEILRQVQKLLGQYQYAQACQLLDPIIAKRKRDS